VATNASIDLGQNRQRAFAICSQHLLHSFPQMKLFLKEMEASVGNPFTRQFFFAVLLITAGLPFGHANDGEMSSPSVEQHESVRYPSDFETGLGHFTDSKKFQDVLREFVSAAAEDNLAVLTSLISSRVVASVGENKLAEHLRLQIVPFFTDFNQLHNVIAVNPAVDETGVQIGYCFYTYIKTRSGAIRPFILCVIRDAEELKVSDIAVNQCRVDRHPFCP
jgi:hypothetical protein